MKDKGEDETFHPMEDLVAVEKELNSIRTALARLRPPSPSPPPPPPPPPPCSVHEERPAAVGTQTSAKMQDEIELPVGDGSSDFEPPTDKHEIEPPIHVGGGSSGSSTSEFEPPIGDGASDIEPTAGESTRPSIADGASDVERSNLESSTEDDTSELYVTAEDNASKIESPTKDKFEPPTEDDVEPTAEKEKTKPPEDGGIDSPEKGGSIEPPAEDGNIGPPTEDSVSDSIWEESVFSSDWASNEELFLSSSSSPSSIDPATCSSVVLTELQATPTLLPTASCDAIPQTTPTIVQATPTLPTIQAIQEPVPSSRADQATPTCVLKTSPSATQTTPSVLSLTTPTPVQATPLSSTCISDRSSSYMGLGKGGRGLTPPLPLSSSSSPSPTSFVRGRVSVGLGRGRNPTYPRSFELRPGSASSSSSTPASHGLQNNTGSSNSFHFPGSQKRPPAVGLGRGKFPSFSPALANNLSLVVAKPGAEERGQTPFIKTHDWTEQASGNKPWT